VLIEAGRRLTLAALFYANYEKALQPTRRAFFMSVISGQQPQL
jgi:hypothetical protein